MLKEKLDWLQSQSQYGLPFSYVSGKWFSRNSVSGYDTLEAAADAWIKSLRSDVERKRDDAQSEVARCESFLATIPPVSTTEDQ